MDAFTNYRKQINKALTYIEKNLDKQLQITEIAEIAGLSKFHFHRIIKAYLGESLIQYVIRLKMESAAKQLLFSNKKINEIAYQLDYNPESFSKTFYKYFGIYPLAYKNKEKPLISHPKPTQAKQFTLNPENVLFDTKTVLFVRSKGRYDECNTETVWNDLEQFAEGKNLINPNSEFLGIIWDDTEITSEEQLRYDACITINTPTKPQGRFGVKQIQPFKAVKFTFKGAYSELDNFYQQIFSIWFPRAGISLSEKPIIERYLNSPEEVSKENLLTEILIPIE